MHSDPRISRREFLWLPVATLQPLPYSKGTMFTIAGNQREACLGGIDAFHADGLAHLPVVMRHGLAALVGDPRRLLAASQALVRGDQHLCAVSHLAAFASEQMQQLLQLANEPTTKGFADPFVVRYFLLNEGLTCV